MGGAILKVVTLTRLSRVTIVTAPAKGTGVPSTSSRTWMAVFSRVVLVIVSTGDRSALVEVAFKRVAADNVTRRSLCPAGGLIVAVIASKKGPTTGPTFAALN